MALPATIRTLAIAPQDGSGDSLALVPRQRVLVSGTTYTWRAAGEIDRGRAPREVFTRERPFGDGSFRRGRVHGVRTYGLRVLSDIDVATAPGGSVERAAAHEAAFLAGMFARSTLFKITETRTNIAGAAVSRYLIGEPSEANSAVQRGAHFHPYVECEVEFECAFPWWRDTSATATTGAQTLDTTERDTTLANAGDTVAGLYAVLSGTGVGNVTITNDTAGGIPTTVGSGLTLTGIDLADGAITVSWYADDPLDWSVVQDGNDISSVVTSAGGVHLLRGTNTLGWVGTGSISGSITFSVFALWGMS